MRILPRLTLLTTFLCAAALSAGTSALAAGTEKSYVPSGYAGVSQYFQDVPTAKGGVTPPAKGQSGSGHTLAASGTGAKGSAALAKLGSDGAAASAFAKATAPTASGGSTTGSRPSGSSPKSSGAKAGGSGSSTAIDENASSGGLASFLAGQNQGGLGVFLPLVMILSLLGAIVYALGRRRSGGPTITA